MAQVLESTDTEHVADLPREVDEQLIEDSKPTVVEKNVISPGEGAKNIGKSFDWDNVKYQNGFGNYFQTEALPGSLPVDQNNPQVCPYGLYAEQLSGSAFTARRHENYRTWLYRIRPSVTHEPFKPVNPEPWKVVADFGQAIPTPNQLRWGPLPLPGDNEKRNFVEGLQTFCGAGSPGVKDGYAIHMYSANTSMSECAECLCNADGNMLIVPQLGTLRVVTEMGLLVVPSGSIIVIPRGIRFSIDLPDGPSRGYVLEVYTNQFVLPDLGPIGANGLANPNHFEYPVAAFEVVENGPTTFRVLHKFEGRLFEAWQSFSPFNVVAWHGNYSPYKYDLSKFCPMNAVSHDHPDPSIFTVLTCPTATPGQACADFVIFPPRWSVAEHTFRPPYYHRNFMNEFMGLIRGVYEAKQEGFVPGGASLHSCMSPHGPDTATFESATKQDVNKPHKLPDNTLAFMFETNHTPRMTEVALSSAELQNDYYKCWIGLQSHFNGKPEGC
eukprot:CAMPEP_0197849736 /NCGR_PEP_ID=MMETSP1438-20131217/13073_1 /TAXON_ID=1461541 /ORGANISM="Pterosperma sp., Strain CCMP1384" /LENGTH=496 /DNA_ID=CAMNT_0043462555 /DNA_START=239 /DNA_END=1729 /DNA_ORIENTATION=+